MAGRYEITSCEEYGHLYEPCTDGHPDVEDCKIRTCADCGDECEED